MSGPGRWFRLLSRVRVAVYLVLVLLVAYGLWRYDTVRLPPEGCSPLFRFAPGDRLLVDRLGAPTPGDAVLYREPGGTLLLGLVAEPPGSAPREVWDAYERGELWLEAERADCPTQDSRLLGTLPRDAVAGRVVAALPW